MRGVLHLHSETGTEGGFWAFQEAKYIKTDPTNPTGESWSYEGLHILNDGDHLIIYDKDDVDKVVWNGVINLKQHPLFTEHAQGLWIHADQNGIDRDTWSNWFFAGYPAELIRRGRHG